MLIRTETLKLKRFSNENEIKTRKTINVSTIAIIYYFS